MSVIDIVLAVVLLFGFIRGLMKGLFVEVASLLALVLGVYGAIHFSYYVADLLKDTVSWQEKYISITAFAVTFLVIVILISLLGKLLTKLANLIALGIVNKILGGVFGAAKIAVICSVLFLFLDGMNSKFSFIDQKTLDNSIFYHPIKDIVPTIFPSFDTKNLEEQIEEKII